MRFFCLIFCTIFFLSCKTARKSVSYSEPYLYNKVDSLIKQKDFFNGRDLFYKDSAQFTEVHALLAKASLYNAFNRPADSNAAINKLFEFYEQQLTDAIKLDLLRIKSGNHASLFEYDAAAATVSVVLNSFPLSMRADEITDFQNSLEIWQSLADKPKQVVTKNGTLYMKMQRDKVGLKTITISCDSISMPFVLDTGANFSTVNESTAKKMGLIFIDSAIDVGAITGKIVEARLAICPEFNLGSIKVSNAVFLVFPDESLYFPQIDYQLNGIIGFPVIEALDEIQITRNDELIVPDLSSYYPVQNMALDFLTPIIQINNEYYSFDTGAASSMLYSKYFKAHPETYKGLERREFKSGSVGGVVTRSGYLITFSTIINGKKVDVDQVDLYADSTNAQAELFYGNLGQDIIAKFEKITINFDKMFVKFD